MNEDFLEVLNRIASKEMAELIPEEIEFLKARQSYLTPEQLEKFQDILAAPKEELAVKPTRRKKSK